MLSVRSLLTSFFTLFLCASFTKTTTLAQDAVLQELATIEGQLLFPDKKPFNVTTRITLNDYDFQTYSRLDGKFTIYDVPPGIHKLDIHSHKYHFGLVKIQLLPEAMDAPKCLEYAYPGAMKQSIKYPLVLMPHGKYNYFEKKQGFSIFSLVKNPMVIMMLVSVGLMVMMPKMMEGLDPEEKAKMKAQMEAQKDPSKMISQMWGEITGAPEEPKPKRRVKRE